MLPTRRGSHWARQNRRSRNLMEHRDVPLNRGIIAETGIIPPGYNLIRDTFNFEVIETKNTMIEGRDGQGMPVTRVSGLIQMGDKENANGRYYSTNEVLAPAVRDIQEDVRSRAVMGEYDHPCITSKEFDVLTPSGWKKFTDIAVGDVVYSRVNGEMVESVVNGIVDKPFQGEVYRFDGRFIDTCFTGDHKVIMDSRSDRQTIQSECRVSDLVENRKRYNKHRIPKTASWSGSDVDTITIPAIPSDELPTKSPNRYLNDPTQDLVIDAATFVSFLGLWLAEGSLVSNTGIFISQKKSDYMEEIAEMLAGFPPELQWSQHDNGFYLADLRLRRYLEPLGNTYTKYVPEDIKRLSGPLLENLVYWFQIGDGRLKHGRNELFSVSERLVDDLHECVVKYGACGTRSVIEPTVDYEFAGHIIVATRKKVLHQLSISSYTSIHLDDRFLKITPEQYSGNVYCLMTEHGSFYMRHNGDSFWTGNCDAKIHLDRVSHLMSKVWMDGRKVYGEAEILHNLPCGACLRGLFEHKVRVGISSRGVGDMEVVENAGKELYRVMPGYAFVTWDAVAEPSVNGAILQIQEGLNKRLRPIKQERSRFSPDAYNSLLVAEINRYFDIG